MKLVFPNRQKAGKKLAKKLTAYDNHPQGIVLGLPRGGIPIAYEIAESLNLPLDVCLVKKIGLPQYPETAMGAIAEDALIPDYDGKITIIDEKITRTNSVNQGQIRAIAAKVKAELKWRECCYRHYRPMLKIPGSLIILVDDGIATGLTMQAAITALQQHQPQKIVVATPVASPEAIKQLETLADEIICLATPKPFDAVGFWYEDFSQVTDREVCDLLSKKADMKLEIRN